MPRSAHQPPPTVTRASKAKPMRFEPGELYHVYNRGNNRQLIFWSRENYLFFLKRFRQHVHPNTDLLAYCLMPNHFHFLIRANERTCQTLSRQGLELTQFAEGLRHLLSGYTQAINRQQQRTGSLFTQNTHVKQLTRGSTRYPEVCFHYIHQNPIRAGLVGEAVEWEFSSFRDFAGLRPGTLANQPLARTLLDVNWNRFVEETRQTLPESVVRSIW